MDYGLDAVVDAETGFIPGVEGEEDGVIREDIDAFGKGGSDQSGLEGAFAGDVVMEDFCPGLMEEFVCLGCLREARLVEFGIGVETGKKGV